MSVRIARGALGRIRRSPDFFLLQVRTKDADRAVPALARAAEDIAAFGGGEEFGGRRTPSFVSPVIQTPAGPLVQIDAGALPQRALGEIGDLVVRRLQEEGLEDAVVDCPQPGGPLDELATWPQGATLHLHPFPGTGAARGTVPPDWLDAAIEWLAAEARSHARLAADLGRFQFEAALEDARALLTMAEQAGADCLLVHGSAEARVRGVHLHHVREPALLLAAGGQAADLTRYVRGLKDVGRRLSPQAAYAYISIEPTLQALRFGDPANERGRDPAAGLKRKLADEIALDAFSWQVLTAGHLDRLGTPPPDARPLPDGAVELAIGDVADWMPGSPTADTARARGRALLDRVLVDAAEATRLARARRDAT